VVKMNRDLIGDVDPAVDIVMINLIIVDTWDRAMNEIQ
jgi:hypothetical protein